MADNPFAAPKAFVRDAPIDAPIPGMSPKEVRSLYFHSRNVWAVFVLNSLGLLALAFIALIPAFSSSGLGPGDAGTMLFVLGLVVLFSVLQYGLLVRTSWGRIGGIVMAVLSLVNIPLGTIVGIIALIAFIKGKVLFGPERITHREVKEAYLALKRARAF
jgi:membrane-bound ClpP family serine protease